MQAATAWNMCLRVLLAATTPNFRSVSVTLTDVQYSHLASHLELC